MKRLLLVLVMVMMLAGVALADETLNGRTFTLVQYDQLYLLTFQQGPFGPGEMGVATLSCDAMPPLPLNYAFDDPFCLFEGSIRFALIGNQLLFVPEGTLTFTEQLEQ